MEQRITNPESSSIKLSAGQVCSIEANSSDDGGTIINFKSGKCMFIDDEITVIMKVDGNDAVILLEY